MTAGRPAGRQIPADGTGHLYDPVMRVLAGDIAPLAPVVAGGTSRPLRLAVVVPPFGFGSGGHAVVFRLARALEERGHAVTYWVHDPFGTHHADVPGSTLRAQIIDGYAPIAGPVFNGFEHWTGTDVVIATGWQTVYPVMGLPRCRARAYIVNDHEPEFYPTSVESYFAAQTYSLDIACLLGGGDWLRRTLQERYPVTVGATFDYPVDPAFTVRDVERRTDTIVLYGRDTTPRRAVPLALVALEELHRRRPDVRMVLFGDTETSRTAFPHEHLGLVDAEPLSWVYSEATIGMGFSMTHGSLVPHDMMACGLPVLDLAGYGTGVEHADTDLVELAPFDPFAIADRLEALLDDPALRARRSAAGLAYVGGHTWAESARRVEDGLRAVLRAREPAAAAD